MLTFCRLFSIGFSLSLRSPLHLFAALLSASSQTPFRILISRGKVSTFQMTLISARVISNFLPPNFGADLNPFVESPSSSNLFRLRLGRPVCVGDILPARAAAGSQTGGRQQSNTARMREPNHPPSSPHINAGIKVFPPQSEVTKSDQSALYSNEDFNAMKTREAN